MPDLSARSNRPIAERLGHVAEAVQRRLRTFDDFGGDFVGWWFKCRLGNSRAGMSRGVLESRRFPFAWLRPGAHPSNEKVKN